MNSYVGTGRGSDPPILRIQFQSFPFSKTRILSVQPKSVATALTFELPRADCIPVDFKEFIHAEWLDHIPRSVEFEFEDKHLTINHSYKESLRIVVPWNVEDLGVFFLKTVSLPRNKKNYDLVLEIARGTVGRLVDQTENWIAAGLQVDQTTQQQIQRVKSDFQKATFSTDQIRFDLANKTIRASIQLMGKISESFAELIFELRRNENQPKTSLLGCQLDPESGKLQKALENIFNAAVLQIPEYEEPNAKVTMQLESLCGKLHQKGITSCTEPLFQISEFRKQDFATIEDAEDNLLERGKRLVEQCGNEFKLFYPLAQMGFHENNGWSDQEQIHFAFELYRMIKNLQPHIPLLLGINQPFGESQTVFPLNKSPIQLADNLIRMETPVAAFCLEFNLGYYPQGTWARDLYAFNDLLDAWAHFDFPLIIQLQIPGGVKKRLESEANDFEMAAALDSQANWIRQITLLSMAKHNVAGVFYGNLIDQASDQYFGSGLFNNQLKPKPAVETLRTIRELMNR